ncbi:MAG: inositol monophosphatase family protein, partial [Nanoarchaeota archaeon]
MFSILPIKIRANLALPVLEAVMAAGKEILRIYDQDFKATFKQQQEPLTEADLASNKIILKALKKTGIAILSEETKDNVERVNHDLLWIVDPLDGTREFINKNGEFSILVGLAEKGVPVLGIIYQPTTKTLFLSSKSEGAYEKTSDGWKRLKTTSITALSEAR